MNRGGSQARVRERESERYDAGVSGAGFEHWSQLLDSHLTIKSQQRVIALVLHGEPTHNERGQSLV